MTHGISEQIWMDYLDQRLGGADRDQIEAHLLGCSECQEFYQKMTRSADLLQEVSAEVRRRFPLEDEQVHISLAKVLARVLDAEAKQGLLDRRAISERLDYLEEVLATMCGSWTAVNALRVAAESSLESSSDELTQDNWTSFLNRLSAIASVFCGDAGTKLLWEYGQL